MCEKKQNKHDVLLTLAKPLAPEEVRPKQYVAVLDEENEYPSFMWCGDSATLSPHELVRLRERPHYCGVPLKVKAVCLPFVLAKSPMGRTAILDLRMHRIARLSDHYAQAASKMLKQQAKKERERHST